MDVEASKLEQLSKEELIDRLLKLSVTHENRPQAQDSSRRENLLVMRLTTKEQEVHEYLSQLEELRTNVGSGLRAALLDPVVNSLFIRMKDELQQTKDKLNQSQQELNAWKFTADSNTGKRLMAKCRSLIHENEELGRMIETGRLARLEGEVAQSTSVTQQLTQGQAEVDDLLVDLDESMEGMQATIVYLQEQVDVVRRENVQLRTLLGLRPDEPLPKSTARAGALRDLDFDLDAPPPTTLSACDTNGDTCVLENGGCAWSPPPAKTPRIEVGRTRNYRKTTQSTGVDDHRTSHHSPVSSINHMTSPMSPNGLDERTPQLSILDKLAVQPNLLN